MPRTTIRSWLVRSVVASAVVASLMGVSHPAAAASGACPPGTGVTVVVDFGALGGGVQTGCDRAGAGKPGDEIVAAAGFTIDWVRGAPFVCRIDGEPSDLACERTPPANKYWALFRSDGTSGNWTYAATSIEGITGAPGASIGWRFQNSTTTVKPSVKPNVVVAAPPPSTPSSTATKKAPSSKKSTPSSKPTTKPVVPKSSTTATPKAPNPSATSTPAGGASPGADPTAPTSAPTTPSESSSSSVTQESVLGEKKLAAGKMSADADSGTSPLVLGTGGLVVAGLAVAGLRIGYRRRVRP